MSSEITVTFRLRAAQERIASAISALSRNNYQDGGRYDINLLYCPHNFIFNNSFDTELELINRTIGIYRIIDEFLYNFIHDREIDWL